MEVTSILRDQSQQTKKDEEIGKDRIVYIIDPATADMEIIHMKQNDPKPVKRIKFAEGGWKEKDTAIVK